MRTAVCLAMGVLASGVIAEEVVIDSFDSSGAITFNEVSNAASYRVEWAAEADGPWTNSWEALTAIPPTGSGSVTAAVPMLYRVVAQLSGPPPDGMVLIPAGVNTGMDPDAGAYSLTNEAAFYMEKHEVTKAQWDDMRAAGQPLGYNDLAVGEGEATNHPVQSVNWYDAVKWCNARSEVEGRAPVYYTDAGFTQVYRTGQMFTSFDQPYVKPTANGYRLPTDVEWEYAARGGVASRRFPWSDSDNISHGRANYRATGGFPYDENNGDDYHPLYDDGTFPYTGIAGTFAPNGYGLHDMAGNVFEWCYDWFPSLEGSVRVHRSGSWRDQPIRCRVAARGSGTPDSSGTIGGFRPVLPAGQ